jgi:hypothetical protein
MNFKHKSFHSTTSKTANLATLEIPCQSLLQEAYVYIQKNNFYDDKLHVGMIDGI